MNFDSLTPEQRTIVRTLDGPLFVSAGAGSGKTFTLTQRIVWALQPGSAPDGGSFLSDLGQALVITFTDKAAAEIKDRTRSALRDAGLPDQALEVDSAWIGTIHGMCARILRRHALELGIDPTFEVGMGLVTQEMLGRAVESALRDARDDPAFATLMDMYKTTSASPYDPSVEGMVTRLVELASSDRGGAEAIEVPGEVDVAGEVERTRNEYASLAALDVSPHQRELYASAEAALGSLLDAAGPSRELDCGRALALLNSCPTPILSCKAALKDRVREAKDIRATALWNLCLGVHVPALEEARELARRALDGYAAAKREEGVLDNDDLLRMADEALERPEVARLYAERFRLVMVDEFQDTDAQQVRMAKRLSGPGARRLATVGDAQQSIYRFRGADVSVFEGRRAEVERHGGTVTRLTRNFRSHDDVLRFVARVFGGRAGLIGDFMDLEANGGRRDGYAPGVSVPRINVQIVDCARSTTGHKAPVSADRRVAVAASIASRLAAMRDAGARPGEMALLLGKTTHADVYLSALRARGLDCVMWGGSTFSAAPEVAVVADLLASLANPEDSQSLFQVLTSELFRLDADDLVALGTSTDDRHGVPCKRSLSLGLSELEFRPEVNPSERLALAHDVMARAQVSLATTGVSEVCLRVCEESGWLWRLERRGVEGQAVAANVLKAIDHVRDLTDGMGLGPRSAADEFRRWLDVAKEPPASFAGETADVVRVMTIHRSKGLEFPIVAVAECFGAPQSSDGLVVGTVDGVRRASLGASSVTVSVPDGRGNAVLTHVDLSRIPLASLPDLPTEPGRCVSPADWRNLLCARDREGEMAEQCRLLYVALTRAREALVVGIDVTSRAGEVPVGDGLACRVLATLFGTALPAVGVTRHSFADVDGDFARDAGDAAGTARVERTRLELDELGRVCPADGLRIPAEAASHLGNPWSPDLVDPPLSEPDPTFDLFEPIPHPVPLVTWSAREGVFSYSSAHALEVGVGSPRPAGVPLADDAASPEPDGAGPAPRPADADAATHLGSAFHELAQLMAETGRAPESSRVDAVSARWHVSARQRRRLDEALARWARSDIRREALGHATVRPEVPFFCEVDSSHGRYLEGAIDLLCWDPGEASALVVDYKTGDAEGTEAELRESHAMQARYYARVLIDQGFDAVSCAFVCVERDAGGGQPEVVRYEFSGENPPSFQ